jgi:N-acetylmuramoyl-L-alanine amidase
VAYPGRTDLVSAVDSSFLFGSVGTGAASLSINGRPVSVAPNGAFLAWLPFPSDDPARFRLVAVAGRDTARLDYPVRREPNGRVSRGALWVDTLSLAPRGDVWWPRGEWLPLTVHAAAGARVALLLPGGARVPLRADPGPAPVPDAVRAFDRNPANLIRPADGEWYRGAIRGRALGTIGTGPVGEPIAGRRSPPSHGGVWVEVVQGRDTVRTAWPLAIQLLDTMPVAVELQDDPRKPTDVDHLTVGRAVPRATYHWFFPSGTVAELTGRIGDAVRLKLSSSSDAWVGAAEIRPAVRVLSPGPVRIGSITLTPRPDRVEVRIPAGRRIPYQVDGTEKTLRLVLYGAASDINWLRYGAEDSLLALVTWRQRAADEVELTFELNQPLWGYRMRWERDDLLLDLRRPPVLDRRAPLRGRLIVLDPGHPPVGSTGPTGLKEPDATLAVARALKTMLEAGGARVLLTRSDDRPVELWPRVRFADSTNADLLISIHSNALPDGINPFVNSGSSVFYFQPWSLRFARAVQHHLVAELGTRDLGVTRGDLALVRPTWMPAVLAEGLFTMLPEHEAALRSPEGQRLYATALRNGIEQFLRDRGAADRQ